MLTIIEGAIAGFIYGALIGLIKYAALWKNVVKTDREITTGVLYARLGIGYAINIATLFLVFILRNVMPLHFGATLIAAAIGLSLAGKLAPISEITGHVKGDRK